MENSTMVQENPNDIVVTGISGVYAGSKNIVELENHLRNKVNLISKLNINSSFTVGKIPNVNKFDASYFGLTPDYADSMDPMGRILLEKAFESIIDAGYNPETLRGHKIGVYIGVYLSETEVAYFGGGGSEGLVITGITRSFLANRISYSFDFRGPSYCVDTACSSSMHALCLAYEAMKKDECEAAIVGGCNLCLNTGITAQLMKLGVLSPNGRASVLDEEANGYCRAEAVSTVFLQKRKDARRIYATVVHGKVNCDGYKAEGITYPSNNTQKILLREFYEECGIQPSIVDYLELHATGTRIGDREEIKAIEIFCENRGAALKVGSAKSNMGHAEAASTLCSLAKVIIAMKSGIIPPNINYKTPRNDIDALHNGLIEVIVENTPWSGGLVGVNSFGLGGANGHILLKSFEKKKINRGLPEDNLPRLVVVSGRTEEAVDAFLSDLQSNPIDVEYVSLLHEIHQDNIVRHMYRGYTILHRDEKKVSAKEIENCGGLKRPIWFIFAGMGCQWAGMGKGLMSIPVFAKSIQECQRILAAKNIDLISVITEDDEHLLQSVLHSFIAITSVQIALVDLLRALQVEPCGMIGHSAGEIACGYADNCLTREEAILCAYYRGLATIQTNHTKGGMASIGLPFDELKSRLPKEVDIACHNSCNNCTISGPVEVVKNVVNQFQAEKIFAREVNSSGIAFHSRYMKNVGPVLRKYLEKVIIEPKPRSEKWISTSAPKSNCDSEEVKYCSAIYQTNNLLNPVLFEEAVTVVPENAIIIELSPHALLRSVFKQSLKPEAVYVPLMVKESVDSVECFLKSLGKMFLVGVMLKLPNLYPKVNYPVSKETRTLAPLIKWQHDREWNVVFMTNDEMVPGERRMTIYTNSREHSLMLDHIIDDRMIFPGFGYVQLIMEMFPVMYGKLADDCTLVFEKIRFLRMVHIPRDRNLNFIIHIQKGSGNFEIVENQQLTVSGRVTLADDDDAELTQVTNLKIPDDGIRLNTEDVYKEFTLRGYEYRGLFRQIISSNSEGTIARVKWNESWPAFLDTVTQTHILRTDTRNPCLLTTIEKIVISGRKHRRLLENLDQNAGVPVNFYKELDLIDAGGVQIKGVGGYIAVRKKLQKEPQLLVHRFTPYINNEEWLNTVECSCYYTFLLWRCVLSISIKILELATNSDKEFISPDICRRLNDYPHVQASSVIITDKPIPEHVQDSTYLSFQSELTANNAFHLVIIHDINDQKILEDSLQALADCGFIIARISKVKETPSFHNLITCSETIFKDEKFILLRRISPVATSVVCLKLTRTYEWVKELQREINSQNEIILYAEHDSVSGILGFYNCLRKEIPNDRIRCFLIIDNTAPPFSLDEPFYKSQLLKNLPVNVFHNNEWGCYVHYPLYDLPPVKKPHAFVNVGCTGDLKTLNWYQGNITPLLNGKHALAETKLIHVYYSALNFKDVLLATGALSYEAFLPNRLVQECLIGCEFSGRDNDGKRYMGIYPAGAISTMLLAPKLFIWEVSDEWSLEEAATVPIVYLTVISAFFVHGNLKRGESVLIHSGAGGVGQAAINIATFYNCTIFTTVGSEQKREFIKQHFPHIKDSHIGNSRDTTFENLIMSETKGKGVDVVLNSLAEDKLQASVRCLAKGGRFLEIGKLDLLKNNNLGMRIFLRGISFHCILLDRIHDEREDKRNAILRRFERELEAGSVKPIVRTVFDNDDIEKAFRYMTAGKHIGKVLIKVRPEEKDFNAPPKILLKEAVPRFSCGSEKVYLICGGLGGMGMELADWLVLRGAKKLILTSRHGVTNGYQAMRINLWKSYGTMTVLTTADLSKEDEVKNLLADAESLGPVCAIFNLAGITEDKLFENMEKNSFEMVAVPKTVVTLLLDRVSRKLCPTLEHFVVFSSVSCGYGNAAQSNYGFANSSCERICERRREKGLPALAVQWGAVGDVGMMTKLVNLDKSFGLKMQPIRSCLSVLDVFLNQPNAIVTSYIVADKNTDERKGGSLVESVANILGIKDLKSISMYSSLPELGMDSINGMEIKQTLEQQHDIFLSPKEIISLTFAQLEEMQKSGKKTVSEANIDNNTLASIPYMRSAFLTNPKSIDLSNMETIVTVPSMAQDSSECVNNVVFVFPPTDELKQYLLIRYARDLNFLVLILEFVPSKMAPLIHSYLTPINKLCAGKFMDNNYVPNLFDVIKCIGIKEPIEPLAKRLNMKVRCFQYFSLAPDDSIESQAEIYASHIKKEISSTADFNIIASSYGVIIAMEVIKKLCSEHRVGKAVLIDGSLEFAKSVRSLHLGGMTDLNDIQIKVILDILTSFQPSLVSSTLQNELRQQQNWEARLDLLESVLPNDLIYGKKNIRIMVNYLYYKYNALDNYNFELQQKLNVNAVVIRAKKKVFPVPADIGLSTYFSKPPEEYYIDESHFTILSNEKTAEIVNNTFSSKSQEKNLVSS